MLVLKRKKENILSQQSWRHLKDSIPNVLDFSPGLLNLIKVVICFTEGKISFIVYPGWLKTIYHQMLVRSKRRCKLCSQDIKIISAVLVSIWSECGYTLLPNLVVIASSIIGYYPEYCWACLTIIFIITAPTEHYQEATLCVTNFHYL